jgi:hypothetical protein
MFKLRIEIPGLDAAVDRLNRIASGWRDWQRPSIADARRILRETVEDALSSGAGYPGAPWAPRSETSKNLRPGGGMQNLVSLLQDDTTENATTLRLQLTAGTFLSEGGTTAAGSMIPGQTVPGRPLMLISDQAASRIRERQRAHVLESWK